MNLEPGGRSLSPTPFPVHDPATSDIQDPTSNIAFLTGVTHVYHVAGITRAQDWKTFEEVNVKGTMNLFGAVHHAAPDVEHVLLTSSLAAVGRGADGVATEDAPLEPVSRYGRSKAGKRPSKTRIK